MFARASLGQQQDRNIALRQLADHSLHGSHAGTDALYERSRHLSGNVLSTSGAYIRQIFAHFCPFRYMAEAPVISYLSPCKGIAESVPVGAESVHLSLPSLFSIA